MKYEKGFHKQEQSAWLSRLRIPQLPSHAPVQVCLTAFSVGLSVGSFFCTASLQGHVVRLGANYEGELKNDYLPCTRKVLPVCNPSTQDSCDPACCPVDYFCVRDPTVGIYCQDAKNKCGELKFCIELVDVPHTCELEACQLRRSVTNMTYLVYVLSAAGVALDLIDLIICFVLADNVVAKSLTNLLSCMVKFLAFAALVGVGSHGYLAELEESECFNPSGMDVVESSRLMFSLGSSALVFSGLFSCCTVPISAMHGGRLSERPFYRLRTLDLGG